MSVIALMVAALVTSASSGASGAAVRAAPPWSCADFVPATVDVYLHVDDAAALRKQLSNIPLMTAFKAAFFDDDVTARWASVAKRLGRTDEQCFDDLLGRDFVFAMERHDDATDWVLITRLDDAMLAHVVERMKARLCGGGLIDFPCQGLVGAWRAPNLIIAPSRSSPLLRSALAPTAERPPGLSGHRLVGQAQAWARSRVQCFIRHTGLLAGTSVITTDVKDGVASIRHLARFDHLALPADPESGTALDPSLLSRFESMAMGGVIRRQCDAPTTALLTSLFPEAAPCEGMKENAGERWMLILGDVDGAPLVPCRVPAVAIAVEVREPCAGRRQHEAMLRRAVEAFNVRYAHRLGGRLTPPEVAGCADIEDPWHCDLSRPLRAASGDHPLVRNCSLHWRAVVGDDGNWQLYASHRAWLDQVARRLERAGSREDRVAPVSTVDSDDAPAAAHAEGFLRGAAVASMIESWGAIAPEFVATRPARFQEAVGLVATILRGAERVRWRVRRPEAQHIETRLWVELARPSTP